MARDPLPVGRLGRLARLARVGARSGASLLVSKDGRSAAEHAANILGDLRGLAAKAGQMASYVDGVVPEQHREAYEAALGKLRDNAPKSAPAQIRQIIESELGAPPEELFREWDEQPFASASIGQVHRGVLDDGREVAIKVQHPGIDRAIDSDLANMSVLERISGAVTPKAVNSKQVLAEISARFREELDYELEARRQRSFLRFHAEDGSIRIPGVVDSHSKKRVLTSEMAKGLSFEEACAGTETERRFHAETVWRFVFRGNLVGGMFNADPHPGNYLFAGDHITFLDFGCVQPIPGKNLRAARAVHQAACDQNETAFGAAVVALMGTRGGQYEHAALNYVRICFEPLFSSPFRVTRDYVAGLFTGALEMKQTIFAKDRSFVPFPEGMALMNRLQFGFYSVLARLDVEVDYRAEERRWLPASLDEPPLMLDAAQSSL